MKKTLKVIGIFCTTLLTLVNLIRLLPQGSYISKKCDELIAYINDSKYWSNVVAVLLIALGVLIIIIMIENLNNERKKHTFKIGSKKYYKFFSKWYSQEGILSIICDDIDWTKTSDNDSIYDTLVKKSQQRQLNLLVDSAKVNSQLILILKSEGANVTAVPSNIINNYSFSCISVMGNNSAVIVRNKQADEGTKIKFEEVSNNYITSLLNSLIWEKKMKKIQSQFDSLQEINKQISIVWDKNVLIRIIDITSDSDLSYNSTIKPWVMKKILSNTTEQSKILDIGCGCGYLTNCIFNSKRKNISGIDISKTSIKYAMEMYPNINFVNEDIYNFKSNSTYELCIAVMLLNNIPNIDLFFEKINHLLNKNGKMVIVIPHPCFWPNKHIDHRFEYLKECSYEIKFSTKGQKEYPSNIYYFHRPLEKYLSSFTNKGFRVLQFEEILENSDNKLPDILGIVIQKE